MTQLGIHLNMCGYIYFRYVSDECIAEQKHIIKIRVYIWCDKARSEDKVCPFEDCNYRPDMETFQKTVCDMECIECQLRPMTNLTDH